MTALLSTIPGLQVTALFALSVALLALFWLSRVGREARLGLVPGVAWWAVPGLGLLLLAPSVESGAVFGVGAALLLLSHYWPRAYRLSAERPGIAWPWVGLLGSAAMAWGAAQQPAGGQPALLILALVMVLASLAALISAAFYPRPAPAALGFSTRWNRTVTPEWPDLSVTLTEQGAQLKNTSAQALRLAGWSPAGVNAWFRVRDEGGQVVNELRSGQVAVLPVTERDSGVRVWYGKASKKDDTGQGLLFRADWTPTARADQRVLN